MRRNISSGLSLLLVFAVLGCGGGSDKHETVMQDAVEQFSALADAFESVQDKQSAKVAAAKINKICDRFAELGKEAEKLPKISDSEQERLSAKYAPEIKKSEERMDKVGFEVATKGGADPDFRQAMGRFKEANDTLRKLGLKKGS